MSKQIKKLQGHLSNKYGLTFTPEEKVINQLIDKVNKLEKRVKELEERPIYSSHIQ